MKSFVIDIAKCNGCYNCQIACKEEHVGNDWTPYAKPQPDTGQFWMKMHEKVRGSVPKVKVTYVPTPCMHCRDAKCIASCAPGAIYRRDDGLVRHRPGQVHGLHGLPRRLPLRVDLFQQGHEPGAEMHGLRPPSGQGLERAALRRCLSDRGNPVRRGRGVEEPYRRVGRAVPRGRSQVLSSITGTCPNASLPARSSTRWRTSAWRTSG